MAFPIPLLLGAFALFFAKKKKRSVSTGLPPTTPPPLPKAVKKSGSGYPGVSRERMQEIQTMLMANGYGVGAKGLDGRYGPATKQAVWEFQEDWGGLGVDGKPGPKTQAALEEAEAARLDAQRGNSSDQCDPLDPGTWGGGVCAFDGARWVRQAGSLPKNVTPPISAKEVGFSSDYSQVDIGAQFKYGVLDPWLNKRRLDGLIATKHHGPTFKEYFSDNPTSFLSSIFGVKQAGGEAIYGTLVVMSTGGLGLGAKAVQVAVARLASSFAVKASSMGAMAATMENIFGTDAEGMAASAVEAAKAFAKTHTVIVGNKRVKISSLPAGKDSVKSFNKYIVDYIIRFQKMHF